MRTFEYRLYPNKEQARLLMACLIESRHLYNQMLAASKQHYEEQGTFLLKYDLTARFKVAKAYSEQYQQIAVENLNIDAMVKNHHLAKSILDASWGAFLDILEAKAENAGHRVIRVNPRFTTQACSHCGELIHKSLSVRTHICTSCGSWLTGMSTLLRISCTRLGHSLQGRSRVASPGELRSPQL